jgi:hypothetical protein
LGDAGDEVEALLLGEAGDDADQRAVEVIGGEVEFTEQVEFAGAFAFEIIGGVVGGDVRVHLGRPFVVVDAVENAGKLSRARAQDAVEAEAAFGGLDFAGVGGRDGGDPIGVDDAGFEKGDIAEKLEVAGANQPSFRPRSGNTCLPKRP